VLLFHDMVTGVQIPSPATVKDVSWRSWSLPYGWPVQGLWPTRRAGDGAQVLAVDRSAGKDLVAVGDSFGRLRLYHYPLVDEAASSRTSRAHGPEIRRVLWAKEDKALLTVGGRDLCVMQWRVGVDRAVESGDEGGADEEDVETIAVDGGLMPKDDPPVDPRAKPRPSPWDGPWRKALVAPSKPPPEAADAPPRALALRHVHGYRSEDVRNNVRYNPSNDVVWHAGATGVIFSPVANTQGFYHGHRHDIIALAVSEDGRYVATGEAAPAPRVHIWDSAAGLQVAVLPAVHARGISSLAFSRDGTYLASVGQDRHHTVAVYRTFNGRWCDAVRVALERSNEAKVLFCTFCGGESPFPLMLGGVKFASFLYLEGKSLRLRKGVYGTRRKVQPLLCGTYVYSLDVVATGTVSGALYIWKDFRVARTVPAHAGSVYAMAPAELGIVTGGRDGLVKLWDREFNCTRQLNMMESEPRPYYPAVHSVCCNRNGTKLAVGMRGGEVFELAIVSGKRALLTEGHSKMQLRGLAVNPANADQYATIGDDGTLRLWSLSKKKALKRVRLDGSSRALAWSPDGKTLVIGFGGAGGDVSVTSKDGAIMILDDTLEVLMEDRRSKLAITEMKFSKSGALLAVASEDGRVYIHDCAKKFALAATTQKLNDEVRWIDLTDDGDIVLANTADCELALFSTRDGQRVAQLKEHRDAAWHTVTSPFGWYVQGVWPREPVQGFGILSLDRSHDAGLLAVSLLDGGVRLYAYPAQTLPMKAFHQYVGHGRRASRVRFSGDDRYLMSLDCYGGSVFEFKVVEEGELVE
jgi:microtubule-associated protein-like 6